MKLRRLVPLPERFVRDRSGQSGTIGVILILAIVVVGTGVLVTYGSAAITGTQQSAEIQRAEHIMTLFDSQAAMTALGDTGMSSVDLRNTDGGSFSVDEDAGSIRIVHYNYTGDESQRYNETIYTGSLGSIVYENGDTRIAYQGGGVWRTTGNSTTMVSPPEFHYRESTLTFPIVRVQGSDSATGVRSINVDQTNDVKRVFPSEGADNSVDEVGSPYNKSSTDASEEGPPYTNPVANGTIRITVQSEHFQGWASYFRSRTDGNVSVDSDDETVSVALETVGMVGALPRLPSEGNSVPARGIASGHSIDNFTLVLRDPDTNNKFKETAFTFYAQSGGRKFQAVVYSPAKQMCGSFSELNVYYYYENSTTHHEWQKTNVDRTSGDFYAECKDYDDDGTEEPQIVADFTGENTHLSYTEIETSNGNKNKDHPSSDVWEYNVGSSIPSEAYFTEHDADRDSTDSPRQFSTGETTNVSYLTNHYLPLLGPNVDLTVNEYAAGTSSRIQEDDSFGELDYELGSGSQYITYVHVTENRIEVTVE